MPNLHLQLKLKIFYNPFNVKFMWASQLLQGKLRERFVSYTKNIWINNLKMLKLFWTCTSCLKGAITYGGLLTLCILLHNFCLQSKDLLSQKWKFFVRADIATRILTNPWLHSSPSIKILSTSRALSLLLSLADWS